MKTIVNHAGKTYRCTVYPSTVEIQVQVMDKYAQRGGAPLWRYLRSGTAMQRKIAAIAVKQAERAI